MYDDNNIFAKILRKEIPCTLVQIRLEKFAKPALTAHFAPKKNRTENSAVRIFVKVQHSKFCYCQVISDAEIRQLHKYPRKFR